MINTPVIRLRHRRSWSVVGAAVWFCSTMASAQTPTPTSSPADPKSTQIPSSISADLDVTYATIDGRALAMDIFRPRDGGSNLPAILVVHGGGWLKGDKEKFRALALRLAERGYVTAAVEYRLGGEAKFPAGIRDCNAATAYLRKNATTFKVDPDRIAAVGGSAGGHLVGLMAAGDRVSELRHPGFLADVPTHLSAAVVLAGPFQIVTGTVAKKSLADRENSNAVKWIGGDVRQKPAMYKLADVHAKIDPSMPPTLFISGSLDSPERNESSREKMREFGRPTELIVHPDAKHGHWNRPEWILRVVDDIDVFLKKHS